MRDAVATLDCCRSFYSEGRSASGATISAGVDPRIDEWVADLVAIRDREPLPAIRVLVWGPGLAKPASTRPRRLVQDKRRQIVDTLRNEGFVVATSEELVEMSMDANPTDSAAPLFNVAEGHQLETADFVIVLLGSSATQAEIAGLLAKRRSWARRSAVFYRLDELAGGYLDGGPLETLRALGVAHTYDLAELEACAVHDLACQFAREQAESLRGTEP